MAEQARKRAVRSDAKRNREAILRVAVDAFSHADGEVTMESIATRAGVGPGTLYRHFPTREALVAAAYTHEVEDLCNTAHELLANRPADEALRVWMERFVDYVATKRGMAAALQAVVNADSQFYAPTYHQIVDTITLLLERGAKEGLLRADADADDLRAALYGVAMVTDNQPRSERAVRLLNLLLDGLRYNA